MSVGGTINNQPRDEVYTYDAEGRIAFVDEGAPNQALYSYDSANRRVKRVAGGYTTYYIWEGSQVIAEYSDGCRRTRLEMMRAMK